MNLIKKLLYREKASSETYIEYMRKRGASIGNGTTIFSPTNTLIDMTRPWLIDIGNNVQITEGVTILTHGYDWSVLKAVYGELLGSSGRVKIGNNVFIGMNSTILKGVHIGNNVIIGANSLVNKDVPNNSVVAGNPARVIMSLEDYYNKRKKEQYEEASELVRLYRKKNNKEPGIEHLHEYFWLFTDSSDELPELWKNMMSLMNNEDMSYEAFKNNKKRFNSLKEFLKTIE